MPRFESASLYAPPPETDGLSVEEWVTREITPGTSQAAAVALLEKRGFTTKTLDNGNIYCRYDERPEWLVRYVHGVELSVEDGKVVKTEVSQAFYGP